MIVVIDFQSNQGKHIFGCLHISFIGGKENEKSIFLSTIIGLCLCLVACGGSSNDKSQQNETSSNEKQPLEIIDSGYSVIGDDPYIYYGVVIKNPNNEYAMEFPAFDIVMYVENGIILRSDSQTLFVINPNETIYYGAESQANGTAPVKVEFKAKEDKNKFKEAKPTEQLFEISNENEIIDDRGRADYTGNIKNLSLKDFTSVAISVLSYKDNKIVYGTTGYVDSLNANSESTFEVSSFGTAVPEHDSYKISAIEW